PSSLPFLNTNLIAMVSDYALVLGVNTLIPTLCWGRRSIGTTSEAYSSRPRDSVEGQGETRTHQVTRFATSSAFTFWRPGPHRRFCCQHCRRVSKVGTTQA